MDNTFPNCEKLYRAVFPESYMQMFWRKDGTVSSAAFTDKQGLSVERGDFREDENVTVEQCRDVDAVIKYKPSKRSEHHSEIHGSEEVPLLSKSQRKKLAERAKIEYYEK